MNQHLQTILNLIQQAEHFTEEEKTALLKAAKNADKELEITNFKLDRTEKVKRTTAILLEETIEELEHKRKAVEAQNRELEIEAALERVRTVAMGMSKPEDLLNISKIQFNELKQLGFTEIRNALIGIFHDDKNYFADYDYSDFSGGSITNIPYNKNPVIDRSLKQMKSATDAFTEFIVEGNELEEWKAFRKQNGEYDDARITNAVYYYFYSIEQGNVGISAFKKISEEQLYILKKFRNVFDLAYKRYVDITNAEAQARESQIQLALERVRAKSLAMHTTSELQEVIHTVYKELLRLNIAIHGGSFIAINGDVKTTLRCWGSGGTADTSEEVHLPLYKKPFCTNLINRIKRGTGFFTEEYTQEEKKDFFSFLFKHEPWSKLDPEQKQETLSSRGGYTRSCCVSQHTSIFIINHYGEKFSDTDNDILKRFGKVFEQAYTRFLDLQKAEAQAREAQIEAALEKVRSRSLAVHKSEEFNEVVKVVFENLKALGLEASSISINTFINDSKDTEVYICGNPNGSQYIIQYRLPYFDNIISNDRVNAQTQQTDFFSKTYNKEEKDSFYKNLLAVSDLKYAPDEIKNIIISSTLYTMSYAVTNHSMIVVNDFAGNVLSQHHANILKRFSKVFEQTYTRFLDLQKAETQSRESQIQLALERARTQSMIMQHSNELDDTLRVFHEQVLQLNIPSAFSFLWLPDENNNRHIFWAAWAENNSTVFKSKAVNYPLDRNEPATAQCLIDWKGNEPVVSYRVPPEGVKNYFAAWSELIEGVEQLKPEYFSDGLYYVEAFMKYGCFGVMVKNELQEDEKKILERFAIEFERAYTRFLDLQKAEVQARESQIQLALERVRARTMAMQHSDELSETASEMFRQIQLLGLTTWSCGFNIIDKEKRQITQWVSSGDGRILPAFVTPSDEDVFQRFSRAAEKENALYVEEMGGEALKAHYQYMASLPDLKKILDEFQSLEIIPPDFQVFHVASFSYGYLMFITYKPAPEFYDMFKRFAVVFDQTYRRFLDLQKAEEQLREAQIEAALERVRSRTIAMQRSEDLFAVIREVNAQLQLLNFRFDSADFLTDYSDNGYKIWVASVQESFAKPFYITASDNKISELLKETMEQGYNFFTFTLNQEEKNKYFDHVFQTPVAKDASDESKQFIYDAKGMAISCFVVKNIILSVSNFACIPYKDAENEIIRRFAFVFEQSYTRFLDLQKAEAQAREAQIETALEKVRSRSLAMHKSEELQEVVHTVFDKLKELNVDLYTAIIFIFKEGSKDVVWWLANKANQQYARILVPYADNHYLKNLFDAKEGGKDFFATTYSFEEKNELFHHLFEHTDFRYVPEPQKQFLLESELATMSVALAKNTGINITSYSRKSFSESENEILKRFAKVFDQAYTRFLDLQKVETQAREAQVEAALERVRSRTTGMQKSEELREVIQTVFEQLRHLDFNIDSAHFNLNYKENEDYTLWSAAPGQPYPVKTYIPYFDHPVFITARQAKEKGLDFFTESYTQDEKNKFFEHLFKHAPVIPEERRKYILSTPGVAASTVLMNTISLWIINYAGIPYTEAENAILKRFGKIFEQSHTRFLDLQKAEAQAKEAIKRASVDRVRAEIASMRTTSDLERITPIIWNELTTLDVPFVRCGVFIMDEEKQLVETHLSTPDGEAIATFNLPYNAPGETAQVLAHWYKKEMYKQHWNEAKFIEVTQNLLQQGAVTTGEKYLTEGHPADLYLHFLPFLQGMLYAGNTAPLNDDELQSMQNLADAFSTAYARYEDFNKLEEAKGKIETTLSELKATQHQLVQSEKMASLGELTAGIAHEIQNPLNFVNNFSEVNGELIEELQGERGKTEGERDETLEGEIINDIKQNLEKINHHGKRADAIVKGMLQHSRKSEGKKEPTDINALCDEYLRLSYHGLRAKDKEFNADFKTDFDEGIEKINIGPQDIGRVLLNLFNNAFYATNEKLAARGSQLDANYQPLVSVQTKKLNDKVEIKVSDNGNGIPQNIVDKIFQPFFTTKPTGSGTGLGLSLSYDIIKAHGGEIKVETKEGEGSTFIIQLPVV